MATPDDLLLGSFGDSSSSGSAKLAPNSPKIAGGENAYAVPHG
jgi:hypothetical protein